MDAFTPQQTIELCSRIGAKKSHMRLDKLFVNSLLCGPLLGFGCAILVSTNAAPWFQANAPGLIRSIGAFFFPVGLVMIVLSGADLVTSNIMFMTTAFLHRRVTIWQLLLNWTVSFFGNLGGMLFFTCIIMGYGGVFQESDDYRNAAITIAMQKAVYPQWQQIFLRAIGANWLVCFAVFSSISSREVVSKIIAIWWPTMTFVGLALDHVVANMFFIPMAIWVGADISVGYYIWKSMIPTLLGNIVGGGLFVATSYWYLYLTGEQNVEIDFNLSSLQTAMEAGGPTSHTPHPPAPNKHQKPASNDDTTTIIGTDPDHLPHSAGHMASMLGKELSDDGPYAKSFVERTRSGQSSEEKV